MGLAGALGAACRYISNASKDLQPFDPFEILQLPSDATDKEIKKAYRQLSLIYHPDKNPDPKATEYFAEYITKVGRLPAVAKCLLEMQLGCLCSALKLPSPASVRLLSAV
jgi:hypothetical protein